MAGNLRRIFSVSGNFTFSAAGFGAFALITELLIDPLCGLFNNICNDHAVIAEKLVRMQTTASVFCIILSLAGLIFQSTRWAALSISLVIGIFSLIQARITMIY